MVEIVRRLYDEVNVHNMLSSQGFVDNADQIDLFVKTSRILININTLNNTFNSLNISYSLYKTLVAYSMVDVTRAFNIQIRRFGNVFGEALFICVGPPCIVASLLQAN